MDRAEALEQIVFNLRNPLPPLKNGAKMLCAATRDEDSYTIIALWDRAKGTEYVIWTMLADGECILGKYFDKLDEALERFVVVTEVRRVATA